MTGRIKLINKFMKRKIKHLFEQFLDSNLLLSFVEKWMEMDANNIQRALQRIALSETANYIQYHMENVPFFKDKFRIYDFIFEQNLVPGLLLEFGVYKGTSINYIARKITGKTIYGFDSFEGLPESWRGGFPKGTFFVQELPPVEKNVTLIKGLFNDSLPVFLKNQSGPISFLHIDCDLYSSTTTIFRWLGDHIVDGTIILFDEYFNYPSWKEGEYKAFHEFLSNKNITYEYLCYNSMNQQVAVRINFKSLSK